MWLAKKCQNGFHVKANIFYLEIITKTVHLSHFGRSISTFYWPVSAYYQTLSMQPRVGTSYLGWLGLLRFKSLYSQYRILLNLLKSTTVCTILYLAGNYFLFIYFSAFYPLPRGMYCNKDLEINIENKKSWRYATINTNHYWRFIFLLIPHFIDQLSTYKKIYITSAKTKLQLYFSHTGNINTKFWV